MKKIIIPLFLILALVSSIVWAAPAFPHPIYGHITHGGNPVKDVEVKVMNTKTGMQLVTTTNIDGFYMADLANFDQNYREGDPIKVSLVYCENTAGCSKTVFVSGGGNEVSWDVSVEVVSTPLPETVTIVKYVCCDGTAVDDASICPTQPVPPTPEPIVITETKYFCLDGSEVLSKEECPEENNSWLYWVIGVLALLFMGGGGWKLKPQLPNKA